MTPETYVPLVRTASMVENMRRRAAILDADADDINNRLSDLEAQRDDLRAAARALYIAANKVEDLY